MRCDGKPSCNACARTAEFAGTEVVPCVYGGRATRGAGKGKSKALKQAEIRDERPPEVVLDKREGMLLSRPASTPDPRSCIGADLEPTVRLHSATPPFDSPRDLPHSHHVGVSTSSHGSSSLYPQEREPTPSTSSRSISPLPLHRSHSPQHSYVEPRPEAYHHYRPPVFEQYPQSYPLRHAPPPEHHYAPYPTHSYHPPYPTQHYAPFTSPPDFTHPSLSTAHDFHPPHRPALTSNGNPTTSVHFPLPSHSSHMIPYLSTSSPCSPVYYPAHAGPYQHSVYGAPTPPQYLQGQGRSNLGEYGPGWEQVEVERTEEEEDEQRRQSMRGPVWFAG